MILGIDTSLGTAVAVVDPAGAVIRTAAVPDPRGHAEVIGELLRQATDGVDGITHVVAGMGPGPFTGLRIGIAAARAFALGRGIPVVEVPSHLAIALAEIENGRSGSFAVVTDARRREIAVTPYDGLDADGIPRQLLDTALLPNESVIDLPRVDAAELDAAALARVGGRAVAAGRVLTSGEPLYLRSPDVRPPAPRKAVGA